MALEKGILLAKEMALTQVIFESNALTMVQEILSKESNGCLGHLYQGIKDLLKITLDLEKTSLDRKPSHIIS